MRPTNASSSHRMRSPSSAAAFSVKVMAAMRASSASPLFTSASTRPTRAEVFPEPGPGVHEQRRREVRPDPVPGLLVGRARPRPSGACQSLVTPAPSTVASSGPSARSKKAASAASPRLAVDLSPQVDDPERVGIAVRALDERRRAGGRRVGREDPVLDRLRHQAHGGSHPLEHLWRDGIPDPGEATPGRGEPVLGAHGGIGLRPDEGAQPARRRRAAASCRVHRARPRSDPA